MNDKIQITKSFLSSGKDFKITESLTVKHPIIQEIFDIDKENDGFFSENIYYSWVSIFLCDPYNYMVYLDDKKIDYETVSSFDLFIMLYIDMVEEFEETYKSKISDEDYLKLFCQNPYYKAFKFFLDKDGFIVIKDENGKLAIGNTDTRMIMINEQIFSFLSEFIKKINGITEGDRINPDSDFAKQILIEDERSRLKKSVKQPKSKNDSNRLGNLLSAVTWGSNGGITPFNRNKLHIYDLVDGVNRTDKILNFNHTMTGLYSGCVDKDKIDMQELSWQS